MSIRTSVKQMLVRQQDKKYEAELAKLRVTYAQWAAEQEKKIAETGAFRVPESVLPCVYQKRRCIRIAG